MRKGISPIVAVVLLIAIAVIAAVGLYFWVGGLATKQPTPSTPIVIGAQRVSCNTTDNNLTVLIQNLDASQTLDIALALTDDNGLALPNGTGVNIAPSSQGQVVFGIHGSGGGYSLTSGRTYTIYGAAGVGQASVVC